MIDYEKKWKPYLNDRLIKKENDYFVIKPVENFDPIPLYCSNCETLYRDREDEQAHILFGCCAKCAMKWAQPDLNKWKSGWRPSPNEVKNEILSRHKIKIRIDID